MPCHSCSADLAQGKVEFKALETTLSTGANSQKLELVLGLYTSIGLVMSVWVWRVSGGMPQVDTRHDRPRLWDWLNVPLLASVLDGLKPL